ncbi:MAG: hypothetical protein O7H41_15665 [Planctomycetota bacterium]|nr:hypothetical protein [Planctomycetota bacterium]
MIPRTAAFQIGLLLLLSGAALPSLLLENPSSDGPLARDELPLTLMLLEVLWVGLLLPLAIGDDEREPRRLASLLLGALILSLPILLLTGRIAAISTAFILGSQALVAGVALIGFVCLAGRGGRRLLFLQGALIVAFVPPFVDQMGEDLLGQIPSRITAAVSPVAALCRAYPDQGPWAAVALFGIGSVFALVARRATLRPVSLAACLISAALLMVGSAPRSNHGEAGLRLQRVEASLDGWYRSGEWAAATAVFENGSTGLLEGDVVVRLGEIEYTRSIRLPAGQTVAIQYLFLMPPGRPSFRVLFRGRDGEFALAEIEEQLHRLFRPLEPAQALIAWTEDAPAAARKILEGISAAQTTIPSGWGGSWQGLEPVDLLVVSGRIGGRMTEAVRRWQLTGGTVLSLSEEASIDLGAPLPAPGEGIAAWRRGRGIIATMDLQASSDRGELFRRAREALEIGVRPERRPPREAAKLFGAVRHERASRRLGAGWVIGLAAFGVVSCGLLSRRFRLPLQIVVSICAIATLPWVVPASLVVDELTVISGSSGSSAASRETILRIASIGPGRSISFASAGEGVARPVGTVPNLRTSGSGQWTLPVSRSHASLFIFSGEQQLGGRIVWSRESTGDVHVRNDTDRSLEGAILVEGNRSFLIGDLPSGEEAIVDAGGEGRPVSQAILEWIGLAPGPFLQEGSLAPPSTRPMIIAWTPPAIAPRRLPGCSRGDPRRALILITLDP